MEDLTGKQLGPYRVVAQLGKGGMATVFKAYQPSMDRYVALKVLPRHLAEEDPQFILRFQQEAHVLAQLQNPHILPVFDFGEAQGYTYLVMPLLSGGTLETISKIRNRVTIAVGTKHGGDLWQAANAAWRPCGKFPMICGNDWNRC